MKRRDLLKFGFAGLASEPILMVAQALLDRRKIGQSAAQASGSARRYVFIQQQDAPARWMFDLLLNPRNQGNFNPGPHMGTVFRENRAGSRYVGVRYELREIQGHHLPPLWEFDLPAPNSGSRTLASLLKHLTHIRGINTNNAGHGFCAKLHQSPPGAYPSIPALAADFNDAAIAAVNIQSRGFTMNSSRGHVAANIGFGDNYIAELLDPFVPRGTTRFRAGYESAAEEIDRARRLIDSQFDTETNRSLIASSRSARSLLETEFSDFEIEWSRLVEKYEDLVQRAIRATYPGINDKPIGVAVGDRGREYNIRDQAVSIADLRNLITNDTTVLNLAEYYAALEFIIDRNLSRSVVINPGGMNRGYGLVNLNSGAGRVRHGLDSHSSGQMPIMLLNTLYFAAHGACMLEFIEVLKSSNKWRDTVIDFSAEFNRSPRSDLGGSDHAFKAASVSLFCGEVENGPHIIGDISRNSGDANRPGTFGNGAPNAPLGGASLSVSHFAATLATLLGVPSPVSAASSLLEKEGGEFNPVVRPGRIV